MEDYHADGRMNGSGGHGAWDAIKGALGIATLLACLVLSVGGVEVAQADPPTAEADRSSLQDGEPVSGQPVKAAPGKVASCSADTSQTSNSARRLADFEKFVQRASREIRRQAKGAKEGESLPVELNSRGYNYGGPISMSQSGR